MIGGRALTRACVTTVFVCLHRVSNKFMTASTFFLPVPRGLYFTGAGVRSARGWAACELTSEGGRGCRPSPALGGVGSWLGANGKRLDGPLLPYASPPGDLQRSPDPSDPLGSTRPVSSRLLPQGFQVVTGAGAGTVPIPAAHGEVPIVPRARFMLCGPCNQQTDHVWEGVRPSVRHTRPRLPSPT